MKIARMLVLAVCQWCAVTALTLDDLGVDVNGFVDLRAGSRVTSDPNMPTATLGETRLQLDLGGMPKWFQWQVKTDVYYDWEAVDHSFDLDTGRGPVDSRQAYVLFSPIALMDVKLGRQTLTWGTGDLLFINDLFPKDWQSFFLGRDEEYLKAPSDAVFISLFPGPVNIDIAYIPLFDADRYVRGERLSYFNPLAGDVVGLNGMIEADTPDSWFRDHEVAVRLSRNVRGFEWAAYGYHGFWKSPAGFDPVQGVATFPRLNVWGASLRGALGGGVANAEVGYYDSRDDGNGDDPFIPNSEWRALIGYEREVARNVSVAAQYYVEWMQDYSAYARNQPAAASQAREDRHSVTLRITQLLLDQNLRVSLFLRYGLTEQDGYIRPSLSYKINDAWEAGVGASLFFGRKNDTFLGQFESNSNVHASIRYTF
ncbi:MAG: DUF1302 family protein [Lentisphaeria bacterium]|nr:DUF1302 family protein [Lentisphaeria bacterium]